MAPRTLVAASAIYDVPCPRRARSPRRDSFLESLMDTELYSIGAYFCDEHPDLVDEVVARSEEIERRGLAAYSRASDGADRGELRDPADRPRGPLLQGGRRLR